MKNPILLVERDEVHAYVQKLWKTAAFEASHREGGYIGNLVDQFASLPRLFCESTNDRLERAHFSTWWGAMMHRDDYTNPVISDLYWLHEIYHAAYMPYVPNIGRKAFDEKMERNELEASVASEIQVYFEMPGLRASSFEHPIYADRYLNDPDMQALWRNNRPVAIDTLRTLRRNVMVGKSEHDMDLTEQWIRRFAEQNVAYGITWSERFSLVETHMTDFQARANRGDRRGALFFHADWLEGQASMDPVDHIPFREEAELSTAFYWRNKASYVASMHKAEKIREGAPCPVPV